MNLKYKVMLNSTYYYVNYIISYDFSKEELPMMWNKINKCGINFCSLNYSDVIKNHPLGIKIPF